MRLTKHYNKTYRTEHWTDLDRELFGQIKKQGSKWYAEIRNVNTGEIVRYAGIWNTRKEALEEIEEVAK